MATINSFCTFCESPATDHFVVPYAVAPVCNAHFNKKLFDPYEYAVNGLAFTLSHQMEIAQAIKAIKADCDCSATMADMICLLPEGHSEELIIAFTSKMKDAMCCFKCHHNGTLSIVFIRAIAALGISDDDKYKYLMHFISGEDNLLLPLAPNQPLFQRLLHEIRHHRRFNSIIQMTVMRAFRESLPAVEHFVSMQIDCSLPEGWLQDLITDCKNADYLARILEIVPLVEGMLGGEQKSMLEERPLGPKCAAKLT